MEGRLTVVSGPLKGQVFWIPQQGELTVGRLPDNNIALGDPLLSRWHCGFYRYEEGFGVDDKGSSNGTFVNDSRQQSCAIEHGDLIRVGPLTFLFEIEGLDARFGETAVSPLQTGSGAVSSPGPGETSADPVAFDVTGLTQQASASDKRSARNWALREQPTRAIEAHEGVRPGPTSEEMPRTGESEIRGKLTVVDGPMKDEVLRIPDQGQLTVGRLPDNDISVPDGLLSRRHSTFYRCGEGFVVADMGSANGTFVNSVKEKSCSLQHGDLIRVGPLTLLFELEGPRAAPGGGEPDPHERSPEADYGTEQREPSPDAVAPDVSEQQGRVSAEDDYVAQEEDVPRDDMALDVSGLVRELAARDEHAGAKEGAAGGPPTATDKTDEGRRTCTNCGKPIEEGSAICPSCGKATRWKAKRAIEFAERREKRKFSFTRIVIPVMLAAGAVPLVKAALRVGKAATGKPETAAVIEDLGGGILVASKDGTKLSKDGSTVLTARKGQPMFLLKQAEGRLLVEVLTPESKHVAWVDRKEVEPVSAKAFKERDVLGYSMRQPRKHTRAIKALAFRADGAFLASVDENGKTVNIWQASRSHLVRSFEGHHGDIVSVAFMKDGAVASLSDGEQGLRIWDPLTTATLRKLPDVRSDFHVLVGGEYIVGHDDDDLLLWNSSDGTGKGSVAGVYGGVVASTRGPEPALVVLTPGNELSVFSVPGLARLRSVRIPEPPECVDVSPDGSRIAMTGKRSHGVSVLDGKSGTLIGTAQFEGVPQHAQFMARGKYLAISFRAGNQICVVSTERPDRRALILRLPAEVQATAMVSSPEGGTLAAGLSNGEIRVWKVDERSLLEGERNWDTQQEPERQGEAENLRVLVITNIKNKAYEQAKSHLKQLEDRYPGSPHARNAREELEREIGKVSGPEAAEVHREREQKKPEQTVGEKEAMRLYSLVRSFIMNKMYDQAKKHFGLLEKEHPNSPYTERARQDLKKALEEVPEK